MSSTSASCHALTLPHPPGCVPLCVQVFVAQGRRRRAESTILESESLVKALQQQTELDQKSLTEIIKVSGCLQGSSCGPAYSTHPHALAAFYNMDCNCLCALPATTQQGCVLTWHHTSRQPHRTLLLPSRRRQPHAASHCPAATLLSLYPTAIATAAADTAGVGGRACQGSAAGGPAAAEGVGPRPHAAGHTAGAAAAGDGQGGDRALHTGGSPH